MSWVGESFVEQAPIEPSNLHRHVLGFSGQICGFTFSLSNFVQMYQPYIYLTFDRVVLKYVHMGRLGDPGKGYPCFCQDFAFDEYC